MITKPPLSEQSLIDCLNKHYGLDVTQLTFLPLGADMNALIYKAQTLDQSSYFIKLKRGHDQDISALMIEYLSKSGIQHIIPLIHTTQGQPTQRLGDFTLSIAPFAEGQDGFSRDLTDDQWITLGNVMRQIHDMEVPQSLQARIRRESYSPKWRQVLRSLLKQIESNPKGDRITADFLTFLKKHEMIIHRLVERAEQLSQEIQSQPHPFVLCHADLHGGNVLIEGTGAFYIVDWDDPIMAPQERDLMFIGGGVGHVWNQSHEVDYFYKGYGTTQVNRTLLSYYRHERIVQDIAEYGQALLFSTDSHQDRLKLYQQCLSQFDPQDVVEITFKTDDGICI